MMDRRAFLGAGLALAASPRGQLLRRAIERAGGREALARASELRWEGQATIFQPRGNIEICVRTRVRPLRSARSDTWLLSQGPGSLRSLIIEEEGGWSEINGTRRPLPQPQVTHERAQYALYGLMLLTPLEDPAVSLITDAATRSIRIAHPKAPQTTFWFDPDGRLARARNRVPAPDDGAEIDQEIRFDGEITSRGVRWPRVLRIEQGGKPYLELRLSSFEAVTSK